ncbi:MAG: ribonuclease HII [Nitratireductor sp.]|nr:ribonuclease HII [Nitratireductor sp.]
MSPRPDTDSLTLFPVPAGPDFSLEAALLARGHALVAGVDEVGRGPLAGPVVAAAVILDPAVIPGGLDDSKKLTAKRREALFGDILANARHVGWASVSASEIDEINIRQATLLAMSRAIAALGEQPTRILIDGRDIPAQLAGRATAIVRGDGKSVSIAAASIVAKVIRDRMMARAETRFPGYGFSSNAGYGTAAHLSALAGQGATPLHRLSFAPLRHNRPGK